MSTETVFLLKSAKFPGTVFFPLCNLKWLVYLCSADAFPMESNLSGCSVTDESLLRALCRNILMDSYRIPGKEGSGGVNFRAVSSVLLL